MTCSPLRSSPLGRSPLGLALPLAVWVVAVGCGGGGSDAASQGPQTPPPSVGVVVAVSAPFAESVALVGEVRAVDSVEIKAELSGVVAAIEFTEGQAVAEGQVLFRLYDDEQRARLREAAARRDLAREEFRRTQTLAKSAAAAEIQLERRAAELEMAEALLDLAQVELRRTVIRAPFVGRIGQRLVSLGARIEDDETLAHLEAIDPIEVATTVAEWAIPLLHLDTPLEVRVAAYPERVYRGPVTYVAPSVDPAIRRIPVKARVKNPDGLLRPGMFATVTAILPPYDAVTLPEEAVLNDTKGAFVWRLGEGNRAERADVVVGAREERQVVIRSGVRAGEHIVAAGTHKVRAGQPIQAVDLSGAAAQGAGGTAGGSDSADEAGEAPGADPPAEDQTAEHGAAGSGA